jgi:hypothetical protein
VRSTAHLAEIVQEAEPENRMESARRRVRLLFGRRSAQNLVQHIRRHQISIAGAAGMDKQPEHVRRSPAVQRIA